MEGRSASSACSLGVLLLVVVCVCTSAEEGALQNATHRRQTSPSVIGATIGSAAAALSRKIASIALDELGLDAVKDLLAAARPASLPVADDDLLLASVEKLNNKLSAATKVLVDMKKMVMNDSFVRSFAHPCPASVVKKVTVEKNTEKLVLSVPKSKPKTAKQRIASTKVAEENENLKIKRQYFMAASDGATDKDCRLSSDDLRLRRLFHEVFQPQPKQIIFALDNSKYMHKNELRVALSIATELVNMLQKTDVVGLVTADGISYEPLYLSNNCSSDSDAETEYEDNRELVLKYINNIEISDEAVFNASVIRRAIDMIDAVNSTIVYIGKDFSWTKEVQNIENETKNSSKIIFNTCDISDEATSSYINDSFLPDCDENLSEQTYCKGTHIHFNSSTTIGHVCSSFLLTLPRGNYNDEVLTATSVWDPVQKDLLLPLILPCASRGLVILDLYLADIAQDVIYFNPLSQKRRSFLINFNGEVIMHSSFSRPEVLTTKPRLVNIGFLETNPQFSEVKSHIFSNSSGKYVIYDTSKTTTYTWKWIKNLYIICIASEVDNKFANSTDTAKRIVSRTVRELQYHRIDLLPPTSGMLCRHFKQVSTIDRGTLYLSPSSFQSPFKYLYGLKSGKEMSLKKLLQGCMAYIKDSSRFLSNPGLRSDIRNDVGLLYPMLSYFKQQHIHGSYNKYIVRRYTSTDHGVLVMFPGSILESDYEPNRKSWFSKALLNPGKIILTPPYLDVGGAGYIVTISYAPRDPSTDSKPVLVVSMDITMGFLYKMLADSLLMCATSHIKCFIMDEQGYLLSHPSLFDRKGTGPIEQQHITHKEPFIANDMLNHKGFVQKKLCKNFVDGTLQRYYNFNTSISGPLTNFVYGEHCSRYHITAIHGTNAFLGIVNSSCNMGAFCPCSVLDRLCLNCNRMEQNECECPCECVLSESTCSAPSPVTPMCDLQPERNNQKNNFFYNLATHLKPCFDFQCDSYRAESSCIGVLGCEWCHLDMDGEIPLSSPFCSAQSSCFGGVLGAVTPYGEGSLGHVIQDDLLASYSAVGPIAGCIVAVCLILAIAVYCYKQNSTSSVADPYLGVTPETWPDPGVQMSHLASEDDIHDERSGHQDKLLANDLVVPISPYRVVTGYRRPNTTGESDHGYSTMTPHDDSEHLAFASMEPFMSRDTSIIGDVASSPAVSLRASITEPMTILPCGKNNVIAPVTVHRHMEAT